MDVSAWLKDLGLSIYAAAFHDHDITEDILPYLSDANLREMGLPPEARALLLEAVAALRAPTPARDVVSPPVPPAASSTGERRQLTVMFYDMVGSTLLSSRLDPEDMRAVIGAYHDCVGEVVRQNGGSVAQYLGDGALVYFGYPLADEHDAERAVKAGLALIDAVGRLQLSIGRLQVRVGIATGLAVVGDLLGGGISHERVAVGRTPNLAAQLQTLADPDTVAVDPNTRLLIGRLFDCADLGHVTAQGFAAPLQAWRVRGESEVVSRFEALRGGGEPLVGRQGELDLLLNAWTRSKHGRGNVVLLSGEPGIGKSRLVAALEEKLTPEPHWRHRHFCSPYHSNSALFPTILQLEREALFKQADTPATRYQKLERLLEPTATPAEDIALFAALLSLPTPAHIDLAPEQRKRRLFEALLRRQERLARQQPMLLIVEDAHWIDPTSRQLLEMMAEQIADLPVLLVITHRPGWPFWAAVPNVTSVTLQRLPREDGAALLGAVAGDRVLPPEVVAEILDRADGMPLFVEELTKAVLETVRNDRALPRTLPTAPAEAHAVPVTLNASLLSRFDRLGSDAKVVAQAGAAIGREFSESILAASVDIGTQAVATGLAQLIQAGLVLRRGAAPEGSYVFKHALVQDVTYSTLLREPRRALHARIAAALEAHVPEIADMQPERLAQHFVEAGMIPEAVRLLERAGDQSFARSATAEAVVHFRAAIKLLAGLPDDPDAGFDAVNLHLRLGNALRAAKGAGSSETGEAYRVAYDLAVAAGDRARVPEALNGLALSHQNRGEPHEAHRIATVLQSFGRQAGNAGAALRGLELRGMASLIAGSLAEARTDLEAAASSYRSGMVSLEASEPPYTLLYLAWGLFAMGLADQARARQAEGVAAAASARPIVAGYTQINACYIDQMDGDWQAARVRAEAARAWGEEKGIPLLGRYGRLFLGWALGEAGHPADGLALIGDFYEEALRAEVLLELPYGLAVVAQVHMRADQWDSATDLLEQALALVERTGERWFEAELHRLRGECLLRLDPDQGTKQAQQCFRQAMAIARMQGALMWELRAAVSLAKTLRDDGARAEARTLLASTLARFSEGADARDIVTARALLDALS